VAPSLGTLHSWKTDNEADLRGAPDDASQTTSEPLTLVRDAELALLKEENLRLKEELKVLSRTLQIDAEEESAGGRKKSKRPASSSYDDGEQSALDAEEEPTGGRKKRKRRASSVGDLTGDARSASNAMDMWIPEEENPSWLRIPVNSFMAGIKDADKAMFPTSIPSTTEARQPFLLTDFYAVGDMIRTAFKGRRNISFMNAAVSWAVFSDQGIRREHNPLSRSAKRTNPYELTREDPVDM